MLMLTPRQVRKCLIRFRKYFGDRYDRSVARELGFVLIDQAIADYDVDDHADVLRTALSISRAFEETKKLYGTFSRNTFNGQGRSQLDLKKKLAECHFADTGLPVVLHFGGPEHEYTDAGDTGGLYLDAWYTERIDSVDAGNNDGVMPAEMEDERSGTIREILAIARELLRSVSLPRLRRGLSYLRQGRYRHAIMILFFGSCIGVSAYLYRLSYDRVQMRGGDVIAERDQRGRLSIGYWQMWKATAPQSEFHILRDGADITSRVRLSTRAYQGEKFYVFEDRHVELGKEYRYQIAHGTGRERDISPVLDVCTPCLVDRLLTLAGEAPRTPAKRIVELGDLTHVSGVYTVGEPALFRIAAPGRDGAPVDPTKPPPPSHHEVEADFGDGYTETFGSEIISHTWVKPGQYFVRAAPIHPSRAMYVSIISVVNPSNGRTPTYSFIVPLTLPRTFTGAADMVANKRIARTIRIPRGTPISFLVDAQAIPDLHDRRAGAVLHFDAGDGVRELYGVSSAPSVDVASISHTYDEVGFYVAMFVMQHPHTGEIGARLIGVRVEPEASFERMRQITADAVFAKRTISDCHFPSLEATMAIVVEMGPKTTLTGVENPVRFDINADGCLDQLGWTAADSDFAFLWIDRDADGFVDSGVDLITRGATPSRNMKPVATTAFDLLREYDNNNDHQLDGRDPGWRQLMVWWDRNHDGVSQQHEVQPLSTTAVAGISLDYDESPYLTREGGHLVWNVAAVAFRDSKIARNVYEMRLAYDKPTWRAMPAWDKIQEEAQRQRVAEILKQRTVQPRTP